MPKNARFITPSAPVLKAAPPSGDGWIHEVKFDGWRAQLHKLGDEVVIFTRNGLAPNAPERALSRPEMSKGKHIVHRQSIRA